MICHRQFPDIRSMSTSNTASAANLRDHVPNMRWGNRLQTTAAVMVTKSRVSVMISMGNAATNERVSLILMDYPNRRRLKILGHLRIADANDVAPKELAQVELADYKARIERVVYIDVAAFDWNCPQHITPRYTEAEIAALA